MEGPNDSDGVQDTGLTYRAFLPFNTEAERSSLRNFTGITKIMDSRYVWVRPKLSNLAVAPLADDTTYRTLSGAISLDGSSPMLEPLSSLDSIRTVKFNCSIILPNRLRYWENDYGRTSRNHEEYTSRIQRSIHGNVSCLEHDRHSVCMADKRAPEGLTVTGYKSWSILSSDDHQVNLGASVCFGDTDSPGNFRVNMWSNHDYQEPYPQWDNGSQAWVTWPILDLVCKTCSSVADRTRSVLHLDNQADWSGSMINSTVEFGIMDSPYIWLGVEKGFVYDNPLDNTMLMSFGIEQRVHKAHIAVFGDTLRYTSNPALALQCLFTILIQMAYYDWFSLYDIAAPAQFVMSVRTNIPHQWVGFGIVGAITGVHLVLVVIVFTLFCGMTEVSLLGDSWAAVAQISASDTRDILDSVFDMRDKEVEKMLMSSGRDITIRGLSRWR